jgi:hypothetical protein
VIGRCKHAAWLHERRAGRPICDSVGVVEFAELS